MDFEGWRKFVRIIITTIDDSLSEIKLSFFFLH